MLHIVKQFIFGLKLGIKSELLDGQQFQNTVDNLDNTNKQSEAKSALHDFFRELAVSQDNDYSFSEAEANSVDFQNEVKDFLTKM
jgi:hypothetical protein